MVAHELTHGVTDYSSQLIYANESGALNEAFSDIMGTAVAFFYQQPGTGSGGADYVVANDVVTPGGIRSMENPRALGDPDHYSIRFTGTADNGGVHINSTIVSHAYYLADRRGHESHVRAERAGDRRRQPRADGKDVLPRLHAADACELDVRDGPRRHHARRAGSVRDRTAPSNAPLSRRGRPSASTERYPHMRRLTSLFVLTTLTTAAPAFAQARPAVAPNPEPRVRAMINGGYQPSTTSFDDSFTFTLYQETGTDRNLVSD